MANTSDFEVGGPQFKSPGIENYFYPVTPVVAFLPAAL